MSGQKNEVGSGAPNLKKRGRKTPEQAIAALREIDADLGAGMTSEQVV